MFGYHQRKRERRRTAEAANALNQEKRQFEHEKPKKEKRREKRRARNEKALVDKRVEESGQEREAGYTRGKERAEELFSRDIKGLDPAKRSAMQYEANKGIQRSHQAADRRLLGEQGQRGITGQGGVGYAQRRDLQRMANDAQGAAHRDLDKLDSDLAMKKLAAMFNIEQGEASQRGLDKQLAIDEMRLNEEKKRQRLFEDQILQNNRNFQRA